MGQLVDIRDAFVPPVEAVLAAYKLLTGHFPQWDAEDGWAFGDGYDSADESLVTGLSALLMWLDEHKPEGP